MTPTRKSQLTKRLNRIAGQVSGLQKMLAQDRYCIDLLTQIAALRSALDSLGTQVLTSHLASCITGTPQTQHPCAKKLTQDQLLSELQTTLDRFLR